MIEIPKHLEVLRQKGSLSPSERLQLQAWKDQISKLLGEGDSQHQPHNYLSEKVEMRNSQLSGNGLFAKETVYPGELVAMLGGNVMTIAEWESIKDLEVQGVCMMIHPMLMIGPRTREELDHGDYINHSCSPNTGLNGQIGLLSLREILPGEEITFDYGTTVGGFDDHLWEMTCKCGSKYCRDTIRPSDWKVLQNKPKLQGYFAPHIQKLINEEKNSFC